MRRSRPSERPSREPRRRWRWSSRWPWSGSPRRRPRRPATWRGPGTATADRVPVRRRRHVPAGRGDRRRPGHPVGQRQRPGRGRPVHGLAAGRPRRRRRPSTTCAGVGGGVRRGLRGPGGRRTPDAWTTVHTEAAGDGGTDDVTFAATDARVRAAADEPADQLRLGPGPPALVRLLAVLARGLRHADAGRGRRSPPSRHDRPRGRRRDGPADPGDRPRPPTRPSACRSTGGTGVAGHGLHGGRRGASPSRPAPPRRPSPSRPSTTARSARCARSS